MRIVYCQNPPLPQPLFIESCRCGKWYLSARGQHFATCPYCGRRKDGAALVANDPRSCLPERADPDPEALGCAEAANACMKAARIIAEML